MSDLVCNYRRFVDDKVNKPCRFIKHLGTATGSCNFRRWLSDNIDNSDKFLQLSTS